uniref:propionate--CoA ligase n=1 Tax=uncultured Acidovorax sp. TaxID=158751 RepID=UPI0025E62968|nr:propionate--CoA ligase [uncultured Acidovorax sp.]
MEKTTMNYETFYRRSVEQPDSFWREQAALIDWMEPFAQVHDDTDAPFERWFVGGKLNLCHNAVDRHAAARPNDKALVWCSTEVGQEKAYTFAELLREVRTMAAALISLGVRRGDRVLIYLPMIPEAAFAMLACARIGAIHSVVFGGFASGSLATRIDDAQPVVIVSADAGSRNGKVIGYKPLLDEAIQLATHRPQRVLMVDRQLAGWDLVPDRDVDYTTLHGELYDTPVACVAMDAQDISYTLYTSGTTGKPKGVQRDTGGYAVALAASMRHIFLAEPGKTFFATSDVGWVVGHSYIVYGPLIAGMATILYEGTPIRPDPSVWWRLVEQHQVTTMFSAPTAIRILRKEGPDAAGGHDLRSLKALFLAGEPLDETTSAWVTQTLDVPVVDNYWQTESGWPILTVARGIEPLPTKLGSTGLPVYGYRVRIVDETTGEEVTQPFAKGLVAIEGPLPPGFMQTVWRDDARFLNTYWRSVPGRQLYSTFDWGYRDEDGYFFIVGRSDDVINVAGHRLGTGEIEASIATHSHVAEVAVVGVQDSIKGQVAVAFVTRKFAGSPDDAKVLQQEICRTVEQQIGAVARPSQVHFVDALPKTRSGKLLRRALQAVAEGRDPGDLSTMEDPAALRSIEQVLSQWAT